MVEVKKQKEGESFDSLLRRFNKRIVGSGLLLQARKVRFLQKPKSKNIRRASALHRKRIKDKIDYLRKSGQLKEEQLTPRKRT